MKRMIFMAWMILCLASSLQAAENYKTFPEDDQVIAEKVKFNNRYGIELTGDMYLPKNLDRTKKYPAIIIGHPFGAVKEQPSGRYAQELARRGFATLAFDASYTGESGGEPRLTVSPETDVDDFSAAVDFMGTRPFVERNRIGAIGICGSGGFALSAAAIDPRMKAIATINMYDMGRLRRQGLNDALTPEQRRKNLEAIGEQRWKEFEGSEPRIQFGTPEKLPENASDIAREFYGYYRTDRGRHPNYRGTRYTSDAALMNFFPFQQIETISPRPILFVIGNNAHSRYFSEDAYKLAAEPKELYVVPNSNHVDLYDNMDKIPFGKLENFFKENLK